MMKMRLFISACIFFSLACTANSQPQFKDLKSYHDSLNVSCVEDSDCLVQNVGNCCGYFPRCLNKDAKPDPAFVREFCAKEQMMGECGFKSINSCKCENQKCVAQAGLSFEEKAELVPLPPQ